MKVRSFSLTILFFLCWNILIAQPGEFRIKNKAGYTNQVINPVIGAAERGIESLKIALSEMEEVWLASEKGNDKWEKRIAKWNEKEFFQLWLGEAKNPKQIKLAYKRLKKMKKVSDRKRIFLVFQAPEKTFNCKWSKHAWTVPFGRASIHCCSQFMSLSPKHQSKAFVHEIGHESGILFHRKVYWRNAALRTAQERPMKALRNPENYAYLVMEYYD